MPGWSIPPTARSSGTVNDTARHDSESGADGLARLEDRELAAGRSRREHVLGQHRALEDGDRQHPADDLVGRPEDDPVRVRRVDRDLADLDVTGLDRLAGRDRLDGDDDVGLLELALTGRLLGPVDQVERRAAGRDGEDDADDDDELSALRGVPVFHLHCS